MDVRERMVQAASARASLLVTAMATLITNPLASPPIYYAAFRTGSFLPAPMLDERNVASSGQGHKPGTMLETLTSASLPTLPGLLQFTALPTAVGFGAILLAWRLPLLQQPQ